MDSSASRGRIIEEHFAEAVSEHPGLRLELNEGDYIVHGVLNKPVEWDGIVMRESFTVEIIFPETYPDRPPKMKEIGGRIRDFHKYLQNTLCLCVPFEVRRRFARNPTLVHYIELAYHHLYAFWYHERYGILPYGEFSHGGEGLFEYYCRFLAVEESIVLQLLRILVEDNYRGHHVCPCGSGKRVRDCHGDRLREIGEHLGQIELLREYVERLGHMHALGTNVQAFLTPQIRQFVEEYIMPFYQEQDDTSSSSEHDIQ